MIRPRLLYHVVWHAHCCVFTVTVLYGWAVKNNVIIVSVKWKFKTRPNRVFLYAKEVFQASEIKKLKILCINKSMSMTTGWVAMASTQSTSMILFKRSELKDGTLCQTWKTDVENIKKDKLVKSTTINLISVIELQHVFSIIGNNLTLKSINNTKCQNIFLLQSHNKPATLHQLWHNVLYSRHPSLSANIYIYTVCRSHSSRSTSISSFKSTQLQRHWQWEMDLIAREQLVSSLKNHHVKSFFYSSPDPRGTAVGGILEGLENTNVNMTRFPSVMYMIHCLFTVKLHVRTGYKRHESKHCGTSNVLYIKVGLWLDRL